ncbi:hypothetical protein D3C87_1037490 [compost metagenome]
MNDALYGDFTANGNRYGYIALRKEFMSAVLSGNVYVRLDGSARNGVIGIVDFSKSSRIFTKKEYHAYRRGKHIPNLQNYARQILDDCRNFREYIERVYYYWDEFELRMDDGTFVKPARFDGDHRGFTWLRSYTGPTVKTFTKVPKSVREAKAAAFVPTFADALGKIVEVGDFASISIGGQMTMGTVTEIVKTGKSIRVKGIMNNTETLITDQSKLIVIDGETKVRAMMKKLSK